MAGIRPGLPPILAQYRLLEKIGEGGMGEVYRARDERLDRDVAIKVLPSDALSDETARKYFRKEALALSRLNHPNIETIFDFNSDQGVDFIVTEHIAGEGLDHTLASGAMPEKDILRLGAQLADGLSAAHEQGIIHRDLKPANLRITADGRLKILDFGVAKLTLPERPDADTISLGESVRYAGTLPYMAPEQVRGEKLDGRTDIWGAGTVLYAMAAGRRPFRARGLEVTEQILNETPPATGASPALDAIIHKCLDKDPAQRYQSARELAVDLQRLLVRVSVERQRTPSSVARRYAKPLALGLGVLALAMVMLFALNVGSWRERLLGRSDAGHIESIAVLPLANLSGDPQQEYFADGMTEELIATLGKISALRVISRTSVMQYKQAKKALPTIAHELNIDAVVEGSVLLHGNRVRITVQLIQAKADRHLWAESYERDLGDILALQNEVARSIAAGIRIELAPYDQMRLATTRSVNPAAYQAYLQGRYHWNKRSRQGVLQGLEYFQKSVQLDPSYPLGYAGLADSYIILAANHWLSPGEAIPQARLAAQKALSLDETLAEPHTSMASIAEADWDWATAEKEYQRALALNPSYATAHLWYSVFLSEMDRHEEALAEVRRSVEIDPLSLINLAAVCQAFYLDHRYDEAQQCLAKVLRYDANFWPAQYGLGVAYVQNGRFEEGIAALKKAAILSPEDDVVLSTLVYAFGRAGRKAEAQKALSEWMKLSTPRHKSSYLLALSYVGLGEKEKAMQALETAYEERDTLMVMVGAEPMFDVLHSHARFQELLRRMNLPLAGFSMTPGRAEAGVAKARLEDDNGGSE